MTKYLVIEEADMLEFNLEKIEAKSPQEAMALFILNTFNSNIAKIAVRGAKSMDELISVWDYFSGTRVKYIFELKDAKYERLEE